MGLRAATETESVVQWAGRRGGPRGLAGAVLHRPLHRFGDHRLRAGNEVPGATVHAVERDEAASPGPGATPRLRVAAGDPEVSLAPRQRRGRAARADGTVDLVVSNPPYVATNEAHIPDPEVVDHDPPIRCGRGRTASTSSLVEQAHAACSSPAGCSWSSTPTAGETAPALLEQAGGWTEVADHRDLADRDRYVTARLTGADHLRRREGATTTAGVTPPSPRCAAVTWRCCPPTPCTASPPTPHPDRGGAADGAKGRGRDCGAGPGGSLAHPRRPWPRRSPRSPASSSRRSGQGR